MAVRLLALDMDGTTLSDDHVTVSEKNLEAIRRAIGQGVHFVPATGRMKNHLPEDIMELTGWDYAVTSNGAAVYHMKTGELVYADFLDKGMLVKIIAELRKYPVYFELYCDGDAYADRERFEQYEKYHIPEEDLDFIRHKSHFVEDLAEFLLQEEINVEKIYIPYILPEIHEDLKRMLSGFQVALTSSVDTNIEVNSKTANKGNALKHLCDYLQVAPSEVLAAGDNNNDYEMIAFAGISIAMGNADERVKKLAHHVVGTNEEDGVAEAINRFI